MRHFPTMVNTEFKKKILKWSNKIGHREAVKRLVSAGVSPSSAQRLVCGQYRSELRFETCKLIKLAMEVFHVEGNRAAE